MDFAWVVSTVLGTAFNVAALYYTMRADRRAERDRRGPATSAEGSPAAQPPRPAPVYPPPATLGGRAAGRNAPLETGGFALWTGYLEVIFVVTTIVYMIPGYMVKQYGSVQDYADAFQAGVVMTGLTAIGLAASAWIRGNTDLRLNGRITRRVVYFHALVALAGLIVCVAAAVANPQYVL
jgi:hypothetical protein